MKFSVEKTDAQSAILTLTIAKADYEPAVEKQIKEACKRMNIPGFRVGKAPASLIKRQYGPAILADEFNKAVEQGLQKHIAEEKLEIFGYPIPAEGQEAVDLDNLKDEEVMKFEVGLQPEVSVDLKKLKVDYYEIEVSDKEVDDYMEQKLVRYSKRENVEEVSEESHLRATFVQGEFKKEGSYVTIANLKDKNAKKKFVGKKTGESFKVDVKKLFGNENELAYTLGLKVEELATVEGDYDVTIEEIYEYKKPELNEELFNQLYAEGEVKTADELKAKMKAEIEDIMKENAEYKFSQDFAEALKEAYKLDMPEKFLRRWIEIANKENKEFTPEVMEQEFPKFIENLKLQRLTGAIAKAANIQPSREMIEAFAVRMVRAQFQSYGLGGQMSDEMLKPYALKMLQDKEQGERIMEGAFNDAVNKYALGEVKLNTKKIKNEDFRKLLQ